MAMSPEYSMDQHVSPQWLPDRVGYNNMMLSQDDHYADSAYQHLEYGQHYVPAAGFKRRSRSELSLEWTCPERGCGRRYEQWRSLQYHLKSVHRIKVVVAEYRQMKYRNAALQSSLSGSTDRSGSPQAEPRRQNPPLAAPVSDSVYEPKYESTYHPNDLANVEPRRHTSPLPVNRGPRPQPYPYERSAPSRPQYPYAQPVEDVRYRSSYPTTQYVASWHQDYRVATQSGYARPSRPQGRAYESLTVPGQQSYIATPSPNQYGHVSYHDAPQYASSSDPYNYYGEYGQPPRAHLEFRDRRA